MHLIGLDIGTQGVKAVLCNLEGRCLSEAFEPSRPHRPSPGVVEEDPEFQLASCCRLIRICLERAGNPEVAALAIAGQMAGVIGVGADGRAITPYDSWLDTRCGEQIVRMQSEAGERVLSRTGNAPSFNHGPKILWWKDAHPELFPKVAAFVQPGGYVAMRLCGLSGHEAFIDTTYLHFSGFADSVQRRWDEGLCSAFEVPVTCLPRIVTPETRVGGITPEMATATGLPAGTPVFAGCGDTAAGFVACGATSPGICVDVAGTASVFAATTEAFAPDIHSATLGCGCSATPGLWHPYAYVNGGGMNLEWFRRELGAGAGSADDFGELNRLAATVSLREELPYFVPHLGGRVSPPWPALRGGWVGVNWDHGRGELYRAMLESVALEYALYRKALERLLPNAPFRELRITGGGEKSRVWNQLKADVLQMPIVQIERGGGAPTGAAMIAGVGIGALADVREAAARWVQLGSRYEPDPALAGYFRGRLERYENLLQRLNDWSSPN